MMTLCSAPWGRFVLAQLLLLQTYSVMLEQHLHDRKREMIALAAEKRQLELLLLKQKRMSQGQPKFGEIFNGKESLDMPSKMRAILEDNRALKEKSRKLKVDCGQWHSLSSELTAKNQLLHTQLREAKQKLARCSITVEEMDELQVRSTYQQDGGLQTASM